MTSPQDNIVFTLTDDTPAPQPAPAAETEDWEKGLERLQQKRRHLARQSHQPAAEAAQSNRHTAAAPAPFVQPAAPVPHIAAPAPEARPQAAPSVQTAASAPASRPAPAHLLSSSRGRRLNLTEQKQAYQAYLEHWQQQHNLQTAASEAELNNPQILFQEDWLNAQNALHIGRGEPIAEQATVWLAEHDSRVTPEQEIVEEIAQAQETLAAAPETAEIESSTAALAAAAEKIVLLNAYAPPARPGRPLLCLSEPELLAALAEKLRPHLADAVSGMVKTALQKQTALMIQNLQQAFLDEVPKLVDDVLAHNLARALAAVKKEQL
ncbi:hypothetical protein H9Q10_05345 [Eikenella sp. S3360]|uniref:Uncharacterized protein n=1 Tax=Eikenella glucosivorans TaxID=2766967 RepID=A0ABS0N9Z6_9NEIS|nr:hypothetical protein [Eikenella glucosivorans]MBH5329090.1 hypothetical protein [Eikenella glucosivorans]